MINPNHYVSLEIARKLADAGIVLLNNEKAWAFTSNAQMKQKPFLTTIADVKMRNESFKKSFGCTVDFWEYIPAYSFMEIRDELPKPYTLKEYEGSSEEKLPPLTRIIYKRYSTEANTAPGAAAMMLLKSKEEGG